MTPESLESWASWFVSFSRRQRCVPLWHRSCMRLFSRWGNLGIFSELSEGGRDPTSVGRDIHDQLWVVHVRWLTRFIAQGIAPQAWEVENLLAQIFESCRIVLVDFYRFCPKTDKIRLLTFASNSWWLFLMTVSLVAVALCLIHFNGFRRTVSECWVCWTSMVLRSLKRLQGMLHPCLDRVTFLEWQPSCDDRFSLPMALSNSWSTTAHF